MSVSGTNTRFVEPTVRRRKYLYFVGLLLLFALGFGVVFLSDASNRIETQAAQVIARMGFVKAFAIGTFGLVAGYLLIRFAEIALALFFLVGFVKADPRLASSPVDLTVLVAAVILAGVLYRVFIQNQQIQLPREYVLYLPLLAMMAVSLTYTPDLSGGMEKTLRFLCLTSIGIVAPFVIFDDERKIGRFFITMLVGGLFVAINALTMLGGEDRLVSPSGLNTELGAASAVSIIIIWALLFPRMRLLMRIFLYPALGILAIGLIGSGGRFANVSAVVCILLGTLICRKLFADTVIAGSLTLLALPLVWIPSASFEYLESLVHPTQAMGTRNDLMWLGVRMFSEHPLLGVGVDGFRSLSPNPLTYNYPHNLFLEIGSEMGIFAAFAFLLLAFFSFREIIRQLSIPSHRENPLVPTVFLLLIYVFLDAMVSGDINDLRFMWFIFGLPFVLRDFDLNSTRAEVHGDVIPLSHIMTKHPGAPG